MAKYRLMAFLPAGVVLLTTGSVIESLLVYYLVLFIIILAD